MPHLRVNLPCATHVCSTAQGRTHAPKEADISGLIASSIAMRPAGATNNLLEMLVRVLKVSVCVHDVAPRAHAKFAFCIMVKTLVGGLQR